MPEHICCGFTAPTLEEVREHIRGDSCPEILKLRNAPATVVDIGGKRIVAGSPRAVDKYFNEKGTT